MGEGVAEFLGVYEYAYIGANMGIHPLIPYEAPGRIDLERKA